MSEKEIESLRKYYETDFNVAVYVDGNSVTRWDKIFDKYQRFYPPNAWYGKDTGLLYAM